MAKGIAARFCGKPDIKHNYSCIDWGVVFYLSKIQQKDVKT